LQTLCNRGTKKRMKENAARESDCSHDARRAGNPHL
jgi:hypothetical protein